VFRGGLFRNCLALMIWLFPRKKKKHKQGYCGNFLSLTSPHDWYVASTTWSTISVPRRRNPLPSATSRLPLAGRAAARRMRGRIRPLPPHSIPAPHPPGPCHQGAPPPCVLAHELARGRSSRQVHCTGTLRLSHSKPPGGAPARHLHLCALDPPGSAV
jgi:hypothetical protein